MHEKLFLVFNQMRLTDFKNPVQNPVHIMDWLINSSQLFSSIINRHPNHFRDPALEPSVEAHPKWIQIIPFNWWPSQMVTDS